MERSLLAPRLQGFLEFFFGEVFPEPHSTKQIEDGVRWALETDPETLADTVLGPWLASREETLELCDRVACPVLVSTARRTCCARPRSAASWRRPRAAGM